MDRPYSWLKFVDAKDLDDEPIDFDDLKVESPTGDHLGNVDGFIVDQDTGRPYYVVVDSGGWFRSHRFLPPVGHARFDRSADREAFVTDLPRERIDRFPGFRLGEFEKLSAADLKRFNDETCTACSVTVVTFATDEPLESAWEREEFRQPDWWQSEPSRPDRMRESSVTSGAEEPPRTRR